MNESAKKAQSIVGFNNDGGRPKNDFYPTPRIATEALMNVERFGCFVWEPACGDGSMSEVLAEKYHVFSSDIEPHNYGYMIDFLTCPRLYCQNIVTNPPFKLAMQFAQHALDLGCRKLALFGKLAFLEGQKRGAWLETSPLKAAYVFKDRLTLTRNGVPMENSGMIAFAWYVWEADYTGEPVVRWI